MYSYIYLGIFIVGIMVMMSLLTSKSNKMDRAQWALVLLLQFTNLGYLELSLSQTLEGAILANTLLYLGGTILPTIFFVSMLQALSITVPIWVKHPMYLFSIVLLICARYGSQNGIFFKNLEMHITKNGTMLTYDSGVMLKVHDIYILLLIIVIVAVLLITRKTKKKSKAIINKGYMYIVVVMFAGYAINMFVNMDFEVIPVVYIIALIIAGCSFKLSYKYDVDEVVSSMQENSGFMHGHLLVSDNYVALGASMKALEMIPELDGIALGNIETKQSLELSGVGQFISTMIYQHQLGEKENDIIKIGDSFFSFEISDCAKLAFDKHARLLFEITDVTTQQKYLEIVENYNIQLEQEVAKKTDHIEKFNETLINAMADMVESRDPNTGGHIKRTSEAVRILAEEMQKDSEFAGKEQFFKKLIKAAPMHDFGKIAVDDAILRKPGKYVPEEYAIMKTHAAIGAEIVERILAEYDDEEFKKIAKNVAHYHHERVDGSGYPEGMRGDDIPLEAKIMAIIDVYDALVSKRCYKDSFSFEEAYNIINDGMGTQFDLKLKKYFDAVVPQLEAYYAES